MGDVGFTFERLPPERAGVAANAAPAGSCCCCCCCCLHSLGGLVGAVTAKPPAVAPEVVPTAIVGTAKTEPRYTVTREYWIALVLLSAFGFPLFMLVGWNAKITRFEEWGLLVAIFLPAIQLATSLVVLAITTASKRPGVDARKRHLRSITVRAFFGGLIGAAIMAPLLLSC